MNYRGRVPTPLRYAARPAAAVAAGLCLGLAFPGADLWWLAPVGVALLGGATLTVGAVAGLAVFLALVAAKDPATSRRDLLGQVVALAAGWLLPWLVVVLEVPGLALWLPSMMK